MRLLFVDACPRSAEQSRTLGLCEIFLEAYQSARPNATIERIRLAERNLPSIGGGLLEKRERLQRERRIEGPLFALARQFASVDRVLIGAPYWDYSFPSILKIYIEHISVSGISFAYTDGGAPHGLCQAKRAAYIVTSGSPMDPGDWGGGYVSALFRGLFGIPQTDQIRAEGLDIAGNDATAILAKATSEARALGSSF